MMCSAGKVSQTNKYFVCILTMVRLFQKSWLTGKTTMLPTFFSFDKYWISFIILQYDHSFWIIYYNKFCPSLFTSILIRFLNYHNNSLIFIQIWGERIYSIRREISVQIWSKILLSDGGGFLLLTHSQDFSLVPELLQSY